MAIIKITTADFKMQCALNTIDMGGIQYTAQHTTDLTVLNIIFNKISLINDEHGGIDFITCKDCLESLLHNSSIPFFMFVKLNLYKWRENTVRMINGETYVNVIKSIRLIEKGSAEVDFTYIYLVPYIYPLIKNV